MQITSSFDGGNIKVADIDDPENMRLDKMPFNNTSHTPEPTIGWSPARAKQMGRDCLEAISMIAQRLILERTKWR